MLCFLVASTVAEYREQVRASLRGDAPSIILGALIVSVGIAAVLSAVLRRRSNDQAPIWFGVFGLLYGIRLIFDTAVIPFAFSLSSEAAVWIRQLITYVLPVPALLFGYSMFPSLAKSIRRLSYFFAAVAGLGVVADLVQRRPGVLNALNNLAVLALLAAFTYLLFRRDNLIAKSAALRWGVSIFGVCIVVANLRGLGAVRFPFDPEPFGFACFLVLLGRELALRTIANEDRLREIGKELEIATRIQLSILPGTMPQVSGLHVAASYLPMTSVAGDFYEFLRVDENRAGILIADVSGHGVPAALIASMVKVAISAQLPHAEDPALVLTGMNQILCGKMQGQFVSAAYLFLDLQECKLRYAAAGHPALLWWNSNDGRIESLEQNGLLLGIMSRAPYASIERAFRQGDRFLLYTDGLIEGANEAEDFFGEDRVREVLAGASAKTAEECAESILSRLRHFTGYDRGRPQDDDLTVIVVDIRAHSVS